MKQTKTNYGNWIPRRMMYLCWGIAAALALLFLGIRQITGSLVLSLCVGAVFAVFLLLTVYMQICRQIFSFTGGGLMRQVHQFVIDHLMWQGKGRLLDIGCGSGAMTVHCAHRFPKADITGVDYWGTEWSYAKEQCERNAKLEGVAGQITFLKGDAASLDFPSETFDAAVSNFVFHEVKSQPKKRLVVKEALRVVKKGGAFAFHDMFEQKALYGDMKTFVEELKKEGIQEIHYLPNTDQQPFIPDFCKAPWLLKGSGLLYGIK